jgi:hypothetical protein
LATGSGTCQPPPGRCAAVAYEAADCGLLSSDLAAGIRRVKGVKKLGVRLGNWLTVFYRTQSQVDQLATSKSAAGDCALPHRRSGWTSRSLHRLRTYHRHLIQLVQKSPLPMVPGQRTPALAPGAGTGTSAHSLCACRLHASAGTGAARLQNKRLIYHLLFHASAEMLLEIACDPRHPGAEIGFFSVLHSWNQRLQFHPHVHCVLAAGGLAPDHSRWIRSLPSFFLPIGVLSFSSIIVHRPDSLAMEVSSLWRNHARGRTALCSATPASLSTSTGPVRCMHLHPHSRHLLVLRHARPSLASSEAPRPERMQLRTGASGALQIQH